MVLSQLLVVVLLRRKLRGRKHSPVAQLRSKLRSERRVLLKDRLDQRRIKVAKLHHRLVRDGLRRRCRNRSLLELLSEPSRGELTEEGGDLVVGCEAAGGGSRGLGDGDDGLDAGVVAEDGGELDRESRRIFDGVRGRFGGRERGVIGVGVVDDHRAGFASGLEKDLERDGVGVERLEVSVVGDDDLCGEKSARGARGRMGDENAPTGWYHSSSSSISSSMCIVCVNPSCSSIMRTSTSSPCSTKPISISSLPKPNERTSPPKLLSSSPS